MLKLWFGILSIDNWCGELRRLFGRVILDRIGEHMHELCQGILLNFFAFCTMHELLRWQLSVIHCSDFVFGMYFGELLCDDWPLCSDGVVCTRQLLGNLGSILLKL